MNGARYKTIRLFVSYSLTSRCASPQHEHIFMLCGAWKTMDIFAPLCIFVLAYSTSCTSCLLTQS